MKSFPRRILANTALVVGSILLTLLGIEIGLRILTIFDHNYLDNLMSKGRISNNREMNLADIIRLNPDNKIVYELRPGTEGQFTGHHISINSLGMRDKERTLTKPPGTFRILALGDSHTFGWGIKQEDAFPAVLEKLLVERAPSRKFEVMNLGVPGYNTVQEVQVFSTKAQELSPDLVIINFVLNDMDLPNFLATPPDPFSMNTSYLIDFISHRSELLKGKFVLPVGLTPVAPEEETKQFRMPEERIPVRFRALYGWDNMKEAYRRLAQICQKIHIPCILLLNMDDYHFRLRGDTPTVIPHYVRDLIPFWQEEGYLVVDPQDRITTYLEQQGLDTTAIWVSEKDSHSNAIRHRFIAEELLEQLVKADCL